MALQQFNQFDPKIAGLEGNMQAEPRVFAHDAVSVTIGAINNSDSNHGLDMTSGGVDYEVDDEITVTRPTGTGHAVADMAIVVVTAIDGAGAVTDYYIKVSGVTNKNYMIGDTANHTAVSPAGGSGFASTVSNIDIPNTQRRGCCLYIGNSGDVEVIMESGNTAIFVGVATGAFLPILAKRVVEANTDATFILALY